MYWLALHASQSVVRPVPVPVLPGAQAVHTELPLLFLYVPAAQGVTLAPAPVCPASATQSLKATEAGRLLECGRHVKQGASDMGVALYVPATHADTDDPAPV